LLGPKGLFDRIVMNPPFADQQDIRHVMHAATLLKPGGRLVAIMSAGVAFRDDRLSRAFRALLLEHGGAIEYLPEAAFKASGTGVLAVLVTIEG
jgi:16S rRNA G1207 methylase RsmC